MKTTWTLQSNSATHAGLYIPTSITSITPYLRYPSNLPLILPHVLESYKKLTVDIWFDTGHKQRTPVWKSQACLTRLSIPNLLPIQTFHSEYYCSSLLLYSCINTTAPAGCRWTTNINVGRNRLLSFSTCDVLHFSNEDELYHTVWTWYISHWFHEFFSP